MEAAKPYSQDFPGQNDNIEPYASIYVAGIQPLGGWTGKTAVQRLLEIEKNSIPQLIRTMTEDWEKICKKYIGTDLWNDVMSNLTISQFPKILAYEQPFISKIFNNHPEIFAILIKEYFAKRQSNPNIAVDVNSLEYLLQMKRGELININENNKKNENELNVFQRQGNIFVPKEIEIFKAIFTKPNMLGLTILNSVNLSGQSFNTDFQKAQLLKKITDPELYKKAEEKIKKLPIFDPLTPELPKMPVTLDEFELIRRIDPKEIDFIKLINKYGFFGNIPIRVLNPQPENPKEPGICNFDPKLINIELYLLLLKIPFVKSTIQNILNEAFEPLEDYYQFLAVKNLSFDQLTYTKTPIAFIDLYRQHLYDLGTFLGPSLDHVWVPPFSEVELTEIVTTTDYASVESESILETFDERETTSSTKQDFLNELQNEREKSFEFSQSINTSLDLTIFGASGTTTIDHASRLKAAEKTVNQKTMEQTSKVTNSIKRSKRDTTFQSREVRSENKKRRVIKNPKETTTNYEIRRKYQQIGIALEYIGTTLSWLIYIDNPGKLLSYPTSVFHPIKKVDLDPKPQLGTLEAPEILIKEEEINIPFIQDKGNDTMDIYIDGIHEDDYKDGIRNKANSDRTIRHEFKDNQIAIASNYSLVSIQMLTYRGDGGDSNNLEPAFSITDKKKGKYDVTLKKVDFSNAKEIIITAKFVMEINPEVQKKIDEKNDDLLKEWDKEKQDKTNYDDALKQKEKIEMERSIKRRDSLDLRAEERYVVFREIAKKIAKQQKNKEEQVLSDLMNTLFDIEKMVYFVAPDWWEAKAIKPYLITDESEPARYGSSLGWTMQLDGDDQRNAFINSSFIRVALPVRRGMIFEAMSWLINDSVEGRQMDKALQDQIKGELAKSILDEKFEPDGQVENKVPELTFAQFGTFSPDGVNRVNGDNADIRGKVISTWKETVPTKQTVAVEVDYVYEGGQLKPKY